MKEIKEYIDEALKECPLTEQQETRLLGAFEKYCDDLESVPRSPSCPATPAPPLREAVEAGDNCGHYKLNSLEVVCNECGKTIKYNIKAALAQPAGWVSEEAIEQRVRNWCLAEYRKTQKMGFNIDSLREGIKEGLRLAYRASPSLAQPAPNDWVAV